MPKCSDCGFLAVRDNHQSYQLVEVIQEWREQGGFPSDRYPIGPVCFVRAADLLAEIRKSAESSPEPRSQQVLHVINKQRECLKSEPWNQGFSPREHQQMVNDRLLQEEISQRRKDDLAWQAEQREKDKVSQKEQKDDERRWQQKQKRGDRVWGIILLAVGSLLTLLLQWLTKAGK
jgi:hypothetical protein